MAQYYTDFSEAISAVDRTWSLEHLVAGENPDGLGFCDAWYVGGFTVQEVSSTQVIRHVYGGLARRAALLWPSGGIFADVEAMGCVYVDTSTTGKRPAILLRASGRAAGESGYTFEARKVENKVQISKYVSGAYTALASNAYSYSTGWYWIRAKAEGTNLSMRLWPDGTDEPDTWMLTANDNAIAHGFCGVFDFESSDRVSYFKGLRVMGTPLHGADWRWGWGEVGRALPRVISDAECTGGKGLWMEHENVHARRLFVWDAVAPADEIRVLARFKPSAVSDGLHPFRVRAGGSGGAETGYTFSPNALLNGIRVTGYWRGHSADYGNGLCPLVANAWHMVRFELVGVTFRVKVWLATDTEPESWSLETTDPGVLDGMLHQTIGQKGWFGIGSHNGPTSILWDWIAIGTDGDDVP